MGFSCLQVVLYHLGRGLEGFMGPLDHFLGSNGKFSCATRKSLSILARKTCRLRKMVEENL